MATAVTGKNWIKNWIVHGIVLAKDGVKMSKHLKNFTDPMILANKSGSDAIRMYMINSNVVRADNLKFNDEGVYKMVREVILPIYNTYRFLIQNISRWEQQNNKQFAYDPNYLEYSLKNLTTFDKWIISSLNWLIKFVRGEMEGYRLYNIILKVVNFFDSLNNLYVRMSRKKIKGITTQ